MTNARERSVLDPSQASPRASLGGLEHWLLFAIPLQAPHRGRPGRADAHELISCPERPCSLRTSGRRPRGPAAKQTIAEQLARRQVPTTQTPCQQGLRARLSAAAACDASSRGQPRAAPRNRSKKPVVAWFGMTCHQEIEVYGQGVRYSPRSPAAPAGSPPAARTKVSRAPWARWRGRRPWPRPSTGWFLDRRACPGDLSTIH